MKNSSTEEEALPNLWMKIHRQHGVSFMDHLYNQLDAIYPHRWNGVFKSDGAIQAWRMRWSMAFMRDCLTPEQVNRGIDACHEQFPAWPPNLGEFVNLCRTARAPRSKEPEKIEQKFTPEQKAANMKRLHAELDKLRAAGKFIR